MTATPHRTHDVSALNLYYFHIVTLHAICAPYGVLYTTECEYNRKYITRYVSIVVFEHETLAVFSNEPYSNTSHVPARVQPAHVRKGHFEGCNIARGFVRGRNRQGPCLAARIC